MPLFFLLSGYCTKQMLDANKVWPHIGKRYWKLFLPLLFIVLATISFQLFRGANFINLIKSTGDTLYWASGVKVKKHFALGMPWFLVSLMTAGGIVDFANGKIQDRFGKLVIFTLFPFIGFILGTDHRWLPLNLDVTLVCAGFIYMGMMLRQYSEYLQKYRVLIFLVSCTLWFYWLSHGIYIELAGRHYPDWSLSYVEAILSTIVICYIAQILETNDKCRRLFSTVGKHTMMIFAVHALDFMWEPMIVSKSWMMFSVKRVVVDLLIAGILIAGHSFIKKISL